MASVGRAFVDLEPKLGAGFGAALGGKLGTVFKAAAPVAVIGGLFAVGKKFEGAFNQIKTATGATGQAFEGLKASAKNVLAGSAATFEQAATAVGNLSARTGLTGKGLESLAKQEITLARITKTDLAQNISDTTRVFGDWGISTDQQSATLDKLFRASQLTGTGVGVLSQGVVKFGAPLRQLGFSFEQSIGLLGKFEKEGVNTGLVMGSMRIALGKLAKAGKEPKQAFTEQVDAIKAAGDAGKANALALELFGARAGPDMAAAIREGRFDLGALFKQISDGEGAIAKTGAEVSTIGGKFARLKNIVLVALEPIGTKVLEIAEFFITNLVGAVERFGPTVGAVFSDIGAKVGLFKDVILELGGFLAGDAAGIGVAIGKLFGFEEDSETTDKIINIAQTISNVITELGADIAAAAQVIGPAFGKLFGAIGDFVKANPEPVIAGIATALGLLVSAKIIGGIKALATATIAWGKSLIILATSNPLGLIAIGLAALVAGLVYAYKHSEQFRTVVDALGRFLRDKVAPAIKAVAGFIGDRLVPAIQTAIGWLMRHKAVLLILLGPLGLIVGAVALVIKHFDTLKALAGRVIAFFADLIGPTEDLKRAFDNVIAGFRLFGQALIAGVAAIAAPFIAAWRMFGDEILAVIKVGLDIAADYFGFVFNNVRTVVEVAFGFIRSSIENALKVIKGIIDVVLGVLSGDWARAWDGIKGIVNGVFSQILNIVNSALALLTGLVGNALDFIWQQISSLPGRVATLAGLFLGAGLSLGGAILDGIKAGLEAAIGIAADIGSAIIDAVKGAWNFVVGLINSAWNEVEVSAGPFTIGFPDNVPNDYLRLARGGAAPTMAPFWVGEHGPELAFAGRSPLTVMDHAQSVDYARNALESSKALDVGGRGTFIEGDVNFYGVKDGKAAVGELGWLHYTRGR